MFYKNNINIHKRFSFNHVMSLVNRKANSFSSVNTYFTTQISLFLHQYGPPGLLGRSANVGTWAVEAICCTMSFQLHSERSDQLDAETSC